MDKIEMLMYPAEKAILNLSPKKLALAFEDGENLRYATVIGVTKKQLHLQLDEGATAMVETDLTLPDGGKIQPLTRLYFHPDGVVAFASIKNVVEVKKPRPRQSGSMKEPNLAGIRR
jgi:hypothetical protein